MIYLIKTINGDQYGINQAVRDGIAKLLLQPKKDRPDFVELKTCGAIIATASITAITEYRKDPERLPSQAGELAAFNAEWEKDREAVAK